MKKLAIATIGYITFAAAQKRFGDQVMKSPALGQRAHHGRAEAGRAKHIERTQPNDFLLQSVDVFVGARKIKAVLLDGGQRLHSWINKGACPFEKLGLVTYKVTGSTLQDADDKVAALNRKIDSVVASRKAVDFYASAVLQAGVKPTSLGYKVGLRAGSFFRRALGPVSANTDRDLKSGVYDEFMLHNLMDELFAFSENRHLMSANQSRTLFSPGAQIGIFNYLRGRGGVSLGLRKIVVEGLLLAAGHSSVSKKSVHPSSVSFAKAMARVCNEANYQAIRNTKRSEDGFYDTVAEQLVVALKSAMRSVVSAKRAVAV